MNLINCPGCLMPGLICKCRTGSTTTVTTSGLHAPHAPMSPRQALGEALAALERAERLARLAADAPEMSPGARARAKDAERFVSHAADHVRWARTILDGPEAIRQANAESWKDYDESGVG